MGADDSNEQAEIKRFYDTVYYKDTQSKSIPNRHHLQLAKRLAIGPDNRVLDIACGTGEFLTACHKQGATIAGVDLSDAAIDVCKANLPDGEFHACTAENLPFADDQFDVVTCLGSLEHFLSPVAALQEMVRVGKPAARFILLVPNKDFLTRQLGLYGGTHQVDAREVVRTLDEWESIFQAAGLNTVERWKDLHVLSWRWIASAGWLQMPFRAAQALALTVWPLGWQYQVYHLAIVKP